MHKRDEFARQIRRFSLNAQQFHIQLLTGRRIRLETVDYEHDTVGDLMEQIYYKEGCNVDQQVLFFHGQVLEVKSWRLRDVVVIGYDDTEPPLLYLTLRNLGG